MKPGQKPLPEQNVTTRSSFLTSQAMITGVVIAYLLLLLILLSAELGLPGLGGIRATNQVLVLLALFFLPFLLLAIGSALRSVTLKFSGQELYLELGDLRGEVKQQVRGAETRVAAQISTAEGALWPLLAGRDIKCAQRWARRTLIIGAKLNGSQLFFAHLLALWLERNLPGLQCEVRAPNGGSLKNFADLRQQWIDLYVDYTGTCCQYFNLDHRGKTTAALIEGLNEYGQPIGLRWLEPLGPSENYCLVVRRRVAEAQNLRTIRDLALASPGLVFTADPEFLNRRDCYVGLCAEYGFAFQRIDPCRITERYALLAESRADVFVGYETDPELRSAELVVLEDADGFFPSYEALPVVGIEVLSQVPGLEEALRRLRGIMTTAELVDTVQRLRQRGQDAAVARALAEALVTRRMKTAVLPA